MLLGGEISLNFATLQRGVKREPKRQDIRNGGSPVLGGIAQLARALAWHARGRRFDSVYLHLVKPGFAPADTGFLFGGKKSLI